MSSVRGDWVVGGDWGWTVSGEFACQDERCGFTADGCSPSSLGTTFALETRSISVSTSVQAQEPRASVMSHYHRNRWSALKWRLWEARVVQSPGTESQPLSLNVSARDLRVC